MNKFLEPILLKDEFIFYGSVDELKEKIKLDNDKKFTIEWSDNYNFKFLSNWSIGTLIVKGFPNAADGIKGYAKLKSFGENKTKIELKTKVRIELYFFLILMSLMIISGFFAEDDFPNWMFLLLPAGLTWFWFVYRVQERMLFNRLKKYLNEK